MLIRIAMVISTVGYHWEEVYGAYDEFRQAGCEMAFFTVDGKEPKADPWSLKITGPFSGAGFGISRSMVPETPLGQEIQTKFASVKAVSELNADQIDALYLPGGHGCLFDVNRNPQLHEVIGRLYRGGKALSGVCHATSTFAFVRENGRSIVEGKKLTGFPEIVDRVIPLLGLVDQTFLPIPFSNDAALQESGADLKWFHQLRALLDARYCRVDWPFVTGMGPKAARPVARLVMHSIHMRRKTLDHV